MTWQRLHVASWHAYDQPSSPQTAAQLSTTGCCTPTLRMRRLEQPAPAQPRQHHSAAAHCIPVLLQPQTWARWRVGTGCFEPDQPRASVFCVAQHATEPALDHGASSCCTIISVFRNSSSREAERKDREVGGRSSTFSLLSWIQPQRFERVCCAPLCRSWEGLSIGTH